MENSDTNHVCLYHSGIEKSIQALCTKLDDRDANMRDRESASRDAIKAAFNAAEKAAEKTELALKEYKVSANEWRDTVKDLVSKMITRPDVERELKVLDEKIDDLRDYRSNTEGRAVEKVDIRHQSNWSTGLTIVAVMSAISIIISLIHMMRS